MAESSRTTTAGSPEGRDLRPVELRLALAMRGGVSLAVWIGGACAEIDGLERAASGEESSGFWSTLVAHSGYDRVVVDVIAGASAGGLNGVLYATSQVYGFEFGRFRPVWLRVAGIAGLVRRRDEAGPGRQVEAGRTGDGHGGVGGRDGYFPSLLRGDEYFQAQVRTELRREIDGAVARGAAQVHRLEPVVDLRLSATCVEPITRPVPSPADEKLTERRFGSGFHFRHSRLPWERSDFRAGPGATIDDDRLESLAVAARATSSFPGAFEAAFLCSGRPDRFGAPDAGDLRDVFLDRRNDGSGFYVSDGGILDNIPLGRALDAIAAVPADSPTTRVLVYLQPGMANGRTETQGPPAASGGTDSEAARRSTVAVLAGMAAARIGSETINGDIAQLESHNAAVFEAAAVRRATFTPLIAAGDRAGAVLQSLAEERAADYWHHRADEDARLIRDLLADPVGTLGTDRFPARVGGEDIDDSRWRSPLGDWSAAARESLLATLRRSFAERTGDPLAHGVRGILRVTQLLLEWARHVESECQRKAADEQSPDAEREQARAATAAAGDQKARLYRLLAATDAFLERPRRLAWVASVAHRTQVRLRSLGAADPPLAAIPVGDVEATVAQVQEAVDRLCRVDPRVRDDMEAWLEGTADGSALAAHARAVAAAIDGVARYGPGDAVQPSDRVDLRELLAEHLAVIGGELHRLVPPWLRKIDGTAADATRTVVEATPGELLHRLLVTTTIDRDELRRATLGSLEILCFAEYAAGLPGRRPIEFLRLSSASPTPLAPRFAALLDEAERHGLWWDPASRDRGSQQGIHVSLKLAGNELANFSAFLLEHWRANDWMWGRLDAVPTLVELLMRPDEIRRRFPTAAEAIAAFKPLVTARTPTDGGSGTWDWETTPGAPASPEESKVEAELRELFDLPVDDARCATRSIAALRRAIVAARQWEILAEERGLPSSVDPVATPEPGPATDDLVQDVVRYAVGAETIRRNERWPELIDRFSELGTAASRAVVWNASNNGRVDLVLPAWARRVILCATPRLTKWAARRYLAPPGEGRSPRRKIVVSLLLAAAAVLTVLGLVVNAWAFVLGVLIALAVVGGGVWLAWRSLCTLPDGPAGEATTASAPTTGTPRHD